METVAFADHFRVNRGFSGMRRSTFMETAA
jgi:hypothetical protein